ncbi:YIP1 family protein [Acanthopleuribacter pedis]|uniref:Yip1 domain-containing protein n=1 Tax=Acanthopleuribacter pedis TaxID=442870 RepID=A0A8J7Q8K8_9BACT|nr:YIP1 family protein [Acanthopleuribacter pedis]MBO1319965.1 hypothetical protein [Acanthopleuribacter pedis]
MEPFEPPSSNMYEPRPNRREAASSMPEPPFEDPHRSSGLIGAAGQTLVQVYTNPFDFFRGIRDGRSPVPAVIWATVIYAGGSIIQQIFSMMFGAQQAQMEPIKQMLEEMSGSGQLSIPVDDLMGAGQILTLLMVPIIVFLAIFIFVLLHYVTALILGAAKRDFDVYLRVIGYAYTSFAPTFIPYQFLIAFSPLMSIPVSGIGFLIFIHYTALVTIGFYVNGEEESSMHLFKSIFVALAPILICCCLGIGMVIMFSAMIGAAGAGMGG